MSCLSGCACVATLPPFPPPFHSHPPPPCSPRTAQSFSLLYCTWSRSQGPVTKRLVEGTCGNLYCEAPCRPILGQHPGFSDRSGTKVSRHPSRPQGRVHPSRNLLLPLLLRTVPYARLTLLYSPIPNVHAWHRDVHNFRGPPSPPLCPRAAPASPSRDSPSLLTTLDSPPPLRTRWHGTVWVKRVYSAASPKILLRRRGRFFTGFEVPKRQPEETSATSTILSA
jgi:hypothetical protein